MATITQKLSVAFVFTISMLFLPEESFSQFQLEKVEEFKINSLLPVVIVDYHPESKLYLGYISDSKGTKIALIDEDGDFVINKGLVGEGPNQSPAPFNAMAFTKEGDIWLQTAYHLFLYDQKLNVKNKIRYQSGRKVSIYGRMEFFPYFYQNESPSSFSFITNPTGTNSFIPDPDVVNPTTLIEINLVEKDELSRMAPLTDRAMYKVFDKSMFADLYSVNYTIDQKARKIYLRNNVDSEITVYDLLTMKLESRIKINHGAFSMVKKSSISDDDFPSHERIGLAPKNNKLFQLDGGMIVLDYIRGIEYGTYESKVADDPTYHHFQDPAYHRLILFDGTKQVSGDIPLPTNGKVTMALPGNRLLIQLINPDVEEDFIRYGIYKVVESNNYLLKHLNF
ncbi:hypothetical protein MMU07_03575 [Aquiflexum sp. LQ15W]|uniref:hypothetical protein n=1 Tax=Cognataquiflexum nitidum TaxID=2922272 RepID=UPI001F132601|nr:hypothetical protein [Cognataquiflexum nitidum]MCH6198646.1 hypothetical protein [Cognataquiflexum nitidum]